MISKDHQASALQRRVAREVAVAVQEVASSPLLDQVACALNGTGKCSIGIVVAENEIGSAVDDDRIGC